MYLCYRENLLEKNIFFINEKKKYEAYNQPYNNESRWALLNPATLKNKHILKQNLLNYFKLSCIGNFSYVKISVILLDFFKCNVILQNMTMCLTTNALYCNEYKVEISYTYSSLAKPTP